MINNEDEKVLKAKRERERNKNGRGKGTSLHVSYLVKNSRQHFIIQILWISKSERRDRYLTFVHFATYLYFTLFIYLYRYNANSISFYYIFSFSFHFLGKCSKMLTNFNAFIATENFRFFFAESTMFLPRSFALLYYRFEAGYKIKYANTLLYSVKSYRMR